MLLPHESNNTLPAPRWDDGREDFCVFRGDRFLCDTAHDGGAAEVEILLGEPGAIPLLGNVDGY